MEEVQGLDPTVHGSRGFGSTGVKSTANEIGSGSVEKKNEFGQKERTVEKEIVEQNETLKGLGKMDRMSGRTRTGMKQTKKTTEGTSRLSRERQIISVK